MADLPIKKPGVHEALSMLRGVSKEHGDILARHIYSDTMVPEVGNKFAYQNFLDAHKDNGYHVLTDLNDFKEINKLHGNDVGDQAIKAFGQTASKLSRAMGMKAHRLGGDEFSFHADTPERATAFAHELQRQTTKLPKAGNTHNITASIGIGAGKDQAEHSLIEAKKKLGAYDPQTGTRQNYHTPGNAPSVIHSGIDKAEPGKIEQEPSAVAPFVNPLSKSQMAIISDTAPIYQTNTNLSLRDVLDDLHIPYSELEEHFDGDRSSLLVGPIEKSLAKAIAEDHGQESVIFINKSDQVELIYVNGPNKDKYHKANGINLLTVKPSDNFYYLKKEEVSFDLWFNYGLHSPE